MTSGKPLGYGIDFGTSNSAVSIAYPDRVEILPIGPTRSSRTLPSFVYLHRSGQRLAGSEGVKTFLTSGHEKTDCWRCPLAPYGWDTDCRQYRKGGGCNDARLLSGVKHELAKIGFAGTNSWAVDFSVATLVSVVLKRLKTEADEATGHVTTRLVLGHPVVFAGADRAHLQESEAEAFKRLREAAHAAGFEEVEFMAEPVAAVIGEERHAGVEIAVDFGGGTFDVAVMDSRSETPRISGTAGVAVGGELLDGVLFETVVGPALGLDRLPYWLFNDLRTASSVRLVMADPGIPSILARIGGDAGALVHALLYEGHAYDFYRAIEAAKIELSDSESAALKYAPLGLDVPIRRSAFEAMIRPELDTVKQTIVEAHERGGRHRRRRRPRARHRRLRSDPRVSQRPRGDVRRDPTRAARRIHRRGPRPRRSRSADLHGRFSRSSFRALRSLLGFAAHSGAHEPRRQPGKATRRTSVAKGHARLALARRLPRVSGLHRKRT